MSDLAVQQTFAGHVRELRRRLLASVLIIMAAAGISYILRDSLVSLLVAPLHQTLIYTAPSGGFQFLLSVCLGVGVIAALPFIIYNLVRFIEPAFGDKTRVGRKRVAALVVTSFGLALLGLAFAYFLVLPMSFRFFSSFAFGPVKALISTSEYLSFVLGCLITFALFFQLPLLLLTINFINRFPPGSPKRYRRYVIIGSLCLALVLPFTYDPLTQLLVALPAILLFEASIVCIWLVNRRRLLEHPKSELRESFMLAQAAPLSPDSRVSSRRLSFDSHQPVQLG